MTRPNPPLTVVPNGADAPSAPAGASTPASTQDAPQLLDIAHVDYNLHPLKVAGLIISSNSRTATSASGFPERRVAGAASQPRLRSRLCR